MRSEILKSITREQAYAINGIVNSDTESTLQYVSESIEAVAVLCSMIVHTGAVEDRALLGAHHLLLSCSTILQWERRNVRSMKFEAST